MTEPETTTINGIEYTKEELEKLFEIVKDLAETNSYEWPYRGEELQSRATTFLKSSR
jgi:hypothetical protein